MNRPFEIYEGKLSVEIKDFHGHLKILWNISEKSKLDQKALKQIHDDPMTYSVKGSKGFNSLIIKMKVEKNESIFGGGEQYTHLDLKGRSFFAVVQEQGVGRGSNPVSLLAALKGVKGNWYSTYFPQPVFFSTAGYGIVLKTTSLVRVDFKKIDEWIFEIFDSKVDFVLLEGTLEKMTKKFHQMYGSKPPVYDWLFGVWIASQGGTEAAEKVVEISVRNSIPLTALWCQDWCGKNVTKFGRQVYWNWSYDQNDYHDLPKRIEEWKKKGVRFLGYVNPFLIKDGPLYKEAAANGYLVKNPREEPYDIYVTTFPAGMIDLTNPNAYEWYKNLIKTNMLSIGMDGWMADFGEYLPMDACLADGKGIEVHNNFPVLWAKLNSDAVSESEKNAIFFMRAGWLGSTLFAPIHWAGDQNVDWSKSDGLASVIPAMMSMSLCGVKLPHFDTGGYTSVFWLKRTPELFMRWTEVGAFSFIMRTHQGNRPFKNLQFDDPRVLTHFARMSRIHYALKDYLISELNEAIRNNTLTIKPLILDYPDDKNCLKIKYEYLLGRYILVAPVLKPKAKTWKVYLPQDEWIHIWTGKRFKGGEIEIDAPLGYPPVFLKMNYKGTEELLLRIQDAA